MLRNCALAILEVRTATVLSASVLLQRCAASVGITGARYFRRLSCISAVCLIVACGGGSGGGGGASSGGPSPARPMARLSLANAVLAGQVALNGAEITWTYSELLVQAVHYAHWTDLSTATEQCFDGGLAEIVYDDADGSRTVTVGDKVTVRLLGCSGMDGELSFALTSAIIDGATIRSLGGRLEHHVELPFRFTLDGSHDVQYSAAPGAMRLVARNGSLRNASGTTERWTGMLVDKYLDDEHIYRIIIEGAVDSEVVGGRFTITTPSPLSADQGNNPVLGMVVLQGDASRVEFTPARDPLAMVRSAEYRINTSGSDVFGTAETIPWDVLGIIGLFGVVPDSDGLPQPDGNRPPIVTSTWLSPEEPYTTDGLTFGADYYDPDDEPLVVTYQWRRNGFVIRGQGGPALPAAEHAKDDVIVASVFVSDGRARASGHAAVTIQDSPPRLTGPPTPIEVTYGQIVSFQVLASDPDGDPVDAPERFMLDHGPAGMQVDPSSGTVQWLASGPMFDRDAEFHWRVVGSDDLLPGASGTIHVRDTARNYPLARTGVNRPLSAAGLYVGDINGDGQQEILVLSARTLYELKWTGSGYRQTWAYPFAVHAYAPFDALALGDVDGDGHHEIFVAAGDIVAKLDGQERRSARAVSLDSVSRCVDLKFADLGADGRAKLICLAETGIYPHERAVIVHAADTLEEIWRSETLDLGHTMAIGNVDGDPALEIVTANGYVFDGRSFAIEWVHPSGFGTSVDIGDVNDDGIGEIVAVSASFHTMSGYSAQQKARLWELSVPNWGIVRIADIDADSVAEILVPGGGSGTDLVVYQYDSSEGAPVRLFDVLSPLEIATAIGVGDVDGDGALDLVWGTDLWVSLRIGSYDGETVAVNWTTSEQEALEGPFFGGQLTENILSEPGLMFGATTASRRTSPSRLVKLDPWTGGVVVGNGIGYSGQNRASLVVSDYDRDGIDEVFFAPASGGIVAYDFEAQSVEWTTSFDSVDVVALARGDLNGDGHDDLVAMIGRAGSGAFSIHAYDVLGQRLMWEAQLFGIGTDLKLIEHGDGRIDVVAASFSGVTLYSRAANSAAYFEKAQYATPGGYIVRSVAVGDTDGDGVPEIFALAVASGMTHVVRLSPDLELLSSFSLDTETWGVYIEELGLQRKNIVVTTNENSFPNRDPSHIIVVDPVSGAEIWRSPALPGYVSHNSLQYVSLPNEHHVRLSFATREGLFLTR